MRKHKLFKDDALSLYLQGLKPKEIAAKLSVKEEAIYRWKRQDQWDKIYEEQQVRHTLEYLTRVLEEEKSRKPSEATAINSHLLVITYALINPTFLLERRIATALVEVEKALKGNLI